MAPQIGSGGVFFRSVIGFDWNLFEFNVWIKHTGTSGSQQRVFLFFDNTSNYFEALGFTTGQQAILLAEGPAGYGDVTGTTVYTIGAWTHYRYTRENATTSRLHINGALEATLNLDITGRGTSNSDLYISDAGLPLNGVIAGPSLWSDVSSLDQRFMILPTRRPTLWATWPMLPGTSERLRDYSGNGRTLSTGGTLTEADAPPAIWPLSTLTPSLSRTITPAPVGGSILTTMRGLVGP
jgi:hypothetical protein